MDIKTTASLRKPAFAGYGPAHAVAAASLLLAGAAGLWMRSGAFRAGSDFLAIFISILLEAFPFVLLGTAVSSTIHVLVSPALLRKVIPENRFLGLIVASLAGFVFPICECANVPVTRRLVAKGLPTPVAVTFLLSVAIVNPVVLLSTWIAFGGSWNAVLARGGFGMVIAILSGWILGLIPSFSNPLKTGGRKPLADCTCEIHQPISTASTRPALEIVPLQAMAFQTKRLEPGRTVIRYRLITESSAKKPISRTRKLIETILEVLQHCSHEVYEVGRFLIAGAAVAAAMQVLLPRSMLIGIGMHPLLSVLVLMILAYVLSLCSEADAFIASTFAGYFSSGAIVAFMVYGPMMDIKNTLMLSSGFKPRFVAVLLGVTTALCLTAGLLINLLFQGGGL